MNVSLMLATAVVILAILLVVAVGGWAVAGLGVGSLTLGGAAYAASHRQRR